MIMNRDMVNVIYILIALVFFCVVVKSCVEIEIQTVKEINGYKVLQLEDGHWYLRSGRGALEHYIECPKCNSKKTK